MRALSDEGPTTFTTSSQVVEPAPKTSTPGGGNEPNGCSNAVEDACCIAGDGDSGGCKGGGVSSPAISASLDSPAAARARRCFRCSLRLAVFFDAAVACGVVPAVLSVAFTSETAESAAKARSSAALAFFAQSSSSSQRRRTSVRSLSCGAAPAGLGEFESARRRPTVVSFVKAVAQAAAVCTECIATSHSGLSIAISKPDSKNKFPKRQARHQSSQQLPRD